jgi:uncharacterized protein YjiK
MSDESTIERRVAEQSEPRRVLLHGKMRSAQAGPPVRLVLKQRSKLDVRGASGIVALGAGRFAVVDDDKGVYEVDSSGGTRVLPSKVHPVLEDLEGLCPGPQGDTLLALSERTGDVIRCGRTPDGGVDGDQKPEVIGTLPDIGKGRNKGWEGLDFIPAGCTTDEQDRLVAVHEGFPRRIGLFPLPLLEPAILLELPEEAEKDALDLSDVAIDSRSGHLFLLSDESATILEVALVEAEPGEGWAAPELRLLAIHSLDLSRKEKAEALDFDEAGTLWLATDRKARLYELEVLRGPESRG